MDSKQFLLSLSKARRTINSKFKTTDIVMNTSHLALKPSEGEKIIEIPNAVKSSVRDYATEFNMNLFESFLHIFTGDEGNKYGR